MKMTPGIGLDGLLDAVERLADDVARVLLRCGHDDSQVRQYEQALEALKYSGAQIRASARFIKPSDFLVTLRQIVECRDVGSIPSARNLLNRHGVRPAVTIGGTAYYFASDLPNRDASHRRR